MQDPLPVCSLQRFPHEENLQKASLMLIRPERPGINLFTRTEASTLRRETPEGRADSKKHSTSKTTSTRFYALRVRLYKGPPSSSPPSMPATP